MIQDIGPKKLYNQYKNKKPGAGAVIFCFWENQVLLAGEKDNLHFPEYTRLKQDGADYRYLFSIDEQEYYLFLERKELSIPGFTYEKMFQVRSYEPKEQVFAASTAYHSYTWYQDNRFCGRCGAKLAHGKAQRMLQCGTCGNQVFPKIAPAIIVGVVNGDKLLMTKYANREYKRYALVAGFTEIGETPEQTVAREVFEEAGVHVKNIRYYKCQPWGFDSNLLLGYFAELSGDSHITMDTEELSRAEWISRKAIEVEQDDRVNLSLTREMMLLFKDAERYLAFCNKNRWMDNGKRG